MISKENDEKQTIIEINPGLGLLTEKLSTLATNVQLVEVNDSLATYLQRKYSHLHVTHSDFIGLARLYTLDNKDGGKRVETILKHVPIKPYSEISGKIIVATSSMPFFKHLILNIHQNTSLKRRFDIYAIIPPFIYLVSMVIFNNLND